MTPAPDDPKAALRKQAYAARKAAFDTRETTDAIARATAHLLEVVGDLSGAVIAGYMPIRTEIDPIPAMTHLAGRNRIGVPVIQGAGQPLLFREWRSGARMIDGPFGAQVPEAGDDLTPNILIVPLVGFDTGLNRLGYGGGFYDRTLERLRRSGTVRAIGFAFAAQELPGVPVEPTDQLLDHLVTEAGIRSA